MIRGLLDCNANGYEKILLRSEIRSDLLLEPDLGEEMRRIAKKRDADRRSASARRALERGCRGVAVATRVVMTTGELAMAAAAGSSRLVLILQHPLGVLSGEENTVLTREKVAETCRWLRTDLDRLVTRMPKGRILVCIVLYYTRSISRSQQNIMFAGVESRVAV